MRILDKIFFASSNKNKFIEAKNILSQFNVEIELFKCNLEEIQADNLEEIAKHKVIQAFSLCHSPVLVEDAGLFIESLNGFPGPYSSFVFKTMGNTGILNLLKSKNRHAKFGSVIAYCEKKNVKITTAYVDGIISKKEKGGGWGFDPIFIPANKVSTYGELDDKNSFSHRYFALRKFASWYLHKKN